MRLGEQVLASGELFQDVDRGGDRLDYQDSGQRPALTPW
jgi:hypothetical protein